MTEAERDPIFILDGPGSMAALRRWLTLIRDQRYPELPDDKLDELRLIATELAANAIEHAAGPRVVRVVSCSHGNVIVVQVDDASGGLAPCRGRSRLPADRGRGLTMVAGMAEWGVCYHPDGKTVWAAADVTGRPCGCLSAAS